MNDIRDVVIAGLGPMERVDVIVREVTGGDWAICSQLRPLSLPQERIYLAITSGDDVCILEITDRELATAAGIEAVVRHTLAAASELNRQNGECDAH